MAELVSGQDIDIITCLRDFDDGKAVVGLRWAFLSKYGFPDSGFTVIRHEPGLGKTIVVEHLFLPDTSSWNDFATDAESRKPALGPYFDSIEQENLSFVLPFIQLVDPRITKKIVDRVIQVADALGYPHIEDSELSVKLWGHSPPKPPRKDGLNDLLKDSFAHPILIAYYKRMAVSFLLGLALRFEYAVLFGLATDDEFPNIRGIHRGVHYTVHADWAEPNRAGSASTDREEPPNFCIPKPVSGFRATRIPGTVKHPLFKYFKNWVPPAEFRNIETDAGIQPVEGMVPKSPAHNSAINWNVPVGSTTKLLDHQAVLFKLDRFDHGRATARFHMPPDLPVNAQHNSVRKGELILHANAEYNFIDEPGMDYPPLEGWYHYQLWSVNLFGVIGNVPANTTLRHFDDIAPVAPRAKLISPSDITFDSEGQSIQVEIEVEWEAAHDFISPDTIEFRIAANWIPRVATRVQILDVNDVDALRVEMHVESLPNNSDTYKGLLLSTPQGDFRIAATVPGTPGKITAFRSGDTKPVAKSTGIIYLTGESEEPTRIALKARDPAVPATIVAVPSEEPLEIIIKAADANISLPAKGSAYIYFLLLRMSFKAENLGADRWLIIKHSIEDTRNQSLLRWRLSGVNLVGSPVIIFPSHLIQFALSAPAQFEAGLLQLNVTAADDADYVKSITLASADTSLNNLTGNEGGSAQIIVSSRSLAPPSAPGTGAWDENTRLWATSAARYAEDATFELQWGVVSNAVRYEVWRALEFSISDSMPSFTDSDLRDLAQMNLNAFDLVRGDVFSESFIDHIPGRAPMRVLYKVRAISAGGVTGSWSDLIGPVYVPDVRQPPAPNLMSAGPLRGEPETIEPSEDDVEVFEIKNIEEEKPWPPATVERAVELVWTQPGDEENINFEIEVTASPNEAWEVITNPMLSYSESDSRYRCTISSRTPGKKIWFRVKSKRAVPDPADPMGVSLRHIESIPSKSLSTVPTGSMLRPESLSISKNTLTDEIILNWTNTDDYSRLEIGRKAPGKYRYEWIKILSGQSQTFIFENLEDAGEWYFQIRAYGYSRQVKSEQVLLEIQ